MLWYQSKLNSSYGFVPKVESAQKFFHSELNRSGSQHIKNVVWRIKLDRAKKVQYLAREFYPDFSIEDFENLHA